MDYTPNTLYDDSRSTDSSVTNSHIGLNVFPRRQKNTSFLRSLHCDHLYGVLVTVYSLLLVLTIVDVWKLVHTANWIVTHYELNIIISVFSQAFSVVRLYPSPFSIPCEVILGFRYLLLF